MYSEKLTVRACISDELKRVKGCLPAMKLYKPFVSSDENDPSLLTSYQYTFRIHVHLLKSVIH